MDFDCGLNDQGIGAALNDGHQSKASLPTVHDSLIL
jgi:hypothetical protein